jgi:hypothetical protein
VASRITFFLSVIIAALHGVTVGFVLWQVLKTASRFHTRLDIGGWVAPTVDNLLLLWRLSFLSFYSIRVRYGGEHVHVWGRRQD